MTMDPHEYSLPCWRAMMQSRSACLVSVCSFADDSYGRYGMTAAICCTIKFVLASTIFEPAVGSLPNLARMCP